jgi:hypothetical protein
MTKMSWRIGESLWLIICIILAIQLIEKSDDGLKFFLDDGELYRRTADDLLLKCLGRDQV